MMRVPLTGLLVAVVLAAGCGGRTEAAPASVDRLLGLMQRRLAVMHDIARWKWANEKPIADPAREGQILDAVAERGRGRGLDPAFVRDFFAAQMEASKLIQQADFDRWKADGKGPGAVGPDLASSRARIDGLDGEILGALAEVGPSPLPEPTRQAVARRAGEILVGPGIDPAIRERATRSLR